MYPQGRMSHHFREMKEGDSLAVKGPKVHVLAMTGSVRANNTLFLWMSLHSLPNC